MHHRFAPYHKIMHHVSPIILSSRPHVMFLMLQVFLHFYVLFQQHSTMQCTMHHRFSLITTRLCITSHQAYYAYYLSCLTKRIVHYIHQNAWLVDFQNNHRYTVRISVHILNIQYNCTYIYSLAIMHHMSHQTNCPASMEKICITVKDFNRNFSRLT